MKAKNLALATIVIITFTLVALIISSAFIAFFASQAVSSTLLPLFISISVFLLVVDLVVFLACKKSVTGFFVNPPTLTRTSDFKKTIPDEKDQSLGEEVAVDRYNSNKKTENKNFNHAKLNNLPAVLKRKSGTSSYAVKTLRINDKFKKPTPDEKGQSLGEEVAVDCCNCNKKTENKNFNHAKLNNLSAVLKRKSGASPYAVKALEINNKFYCVDHGLQELSTIYEKNGNLDNTKIKILSYLEYSKNEKEKIKKHICKKIASLKKNPTGYLLQKKRLKRPGKTRRGINCHQITDYSSTGNLGEINTVFFKKQLKEVFNIMDEVMDEAIEEREANKNKSTTAVDGNDSDSASNVIPSEN